MTNKEYLRKVGVWRIHDFEVLDFGHLRGWCGRPMIRAEEALKKSREKEVDRVHPGKASSNTDSTAGLGRAELVGVVWGPSIRM